MNDLNILNALFNLGQVFSSGDWRKGMRKRSEREVELPERTSKHQNPSAKELCTNLGLLPTC
jgi:hypothetical protein